MKLRKVSQRFPSITINLTYIIYGITGTWKILSVVYFNIRNSQFILLISDIFLYVIFPDTIRGNLAFSWFSKPVM